MVKEGQKVKNGQSNERSLAADRLPLGTFACLENAVKNII